jgi:hypothetical protein
MLGYVEKKKHVRSRESYAHAPTCSFKYVMMISLFCRELDFRPNSLILRGLYKASVVERIFSAETPEERDCWLNNIQRVSVQHSA